MKTRQQKQEELTAIKEKLAKAKIIIFSSFAQVGQKGLTVSGMKELRASLRPLDAQYSVEKKTLFDRAAHQSFPGSLGVAYGYGDPFAIAKALYQFAKKNPVFRLYGALMGSDFMDEEKFLEMAKLPDKEVLIGRLVGMLSYPIRGLAVALDQIAKQRG